METIEMIKDWFLAYNTYMQITITTLAIFFGMVIWLAITAMIGGKDGRTE